MSTTKFLFLYRWPVEGQDSTLATGAKKPSPQEMQAMYAQWKGWKDKFEKEILDARVGIRPDGVKAVVRGESVTDGPYVESKEGIGGYNFIETTSFERAVEIAKECPIALQPGASIEIRELRTWSW